MSVEYVPGPCGGSVSMELVPCPCGGSVSMELVPCPCGGSGVSESFGPYVVLQCHCCSQLVVSGLVLQGID